MNRTYSIVFAIIVSLSCVGCGEAYHIHEDGAILCGGDGEPIELIDNPEATDPSYAELVRFITQDTTDEHDYAEDFTCGDFAELVHNNAEEARIKAAVVTVYFEDGEMPHVLNAFTTTDRGLVYIDCTAAYLLWGVDINSDKIAYIEAGKEYGILDIDRVTSLFYSSYVEQKARWEEYQEELEAFNKELSEYNTQVYMFNLACDYGLGSKSERERLEEWQQELEIRQKELAERDNALGKYFYEPLGIVSEVNVHW